MHSEKVWVALDDAEGLAPVVVGLAGSPEQAVARKATPASAMAADPVRQIPDISFPP
jgi:hypothetical protein